MAAKQKINKKLQWSVVKKKDCDEPHMAPNETQPIQWIERPTSALVATSSL